MKRTHIVLLITATLLTVASCNKSDETFVISGKVTNFNGKPIDSVTIRLKNKAFENIYETLSDSNGNYSMTVKKGNYYCLYAIKLSEYRVNRLEYWAWNVPVYEDMVINPQYDRMEIYGVNVFEPQVTPQQTYMVYFRPMSLSKTIALASSQQVNSKAFVGAKHTENLLSQSSKLVDMAPDTITAQELSIEINGVKSEIVAINKVTEYARGILMYGYNVQVIKPTPGNDAQPLKYDRISITLHSSQTDETGKAEAFIAR
ncbi:hypothetical protein CYCD_30650 [Tenuifilaceae bacterium CYCD]|nr:hypothetical protein CYCD_30650 [Tenuifilaceae bacterium CYCD]